MAEFPIFEHGFDHGMCHLAERFQRRGVAVFILRYRLASDGYRHPAQLVDGQHDVRLIRHRAADWNLDPARIAVMGFSAGGHVASMLETRFDAGDPGATDPVDRQGCRPDAAILIYPVISLLNKSGTGTNLLGPEADRALEISLSSETQVNSQRRPRSSSMARTTRWLPSNTAASCSRRCGRRAFPPSSTPIRPASMALAASPTSVARRAGLRASKIGWPAKGSASVLSQKSVDLWDG